MTKHSVKPALQPNPALKSLDRIVGTWKVSGEVHGHSTFKWLEGGFFLRQEVDLGDAVGTELIGYDEQSKALTSHYFNNTGDHLEYVYEVDAHTYVVAIDMPGVKGQYTGTFSDGGNTITGRWEWTKDGEQLGFDATMKRVKKHPEPQAQTS